MKWRNRKCVLTPEEEELKTSVPIKAVLALLRVVCRRVVGSKGHLDRQEVTVSSGNLSVADDHDDEEGGGHLPWDHLLRHGEAGTLGPGVAEEPGFDVEAGLFSLPFSRAGSWRLTLRC